MPTTYTLPGSVMLDAPAPVPAPRDAGDALGEWYFATTGRYEDAETAAQDWRSLPESVRAGFRTIGDSALAALVRAGWVLMSPVPLAPGRYTVGGPSGGIRPERGHGE